MDQMGSNNCIKYFQKTKDFTLSEPSPNHRKKHRPGLLQGICFDIFSRIIFSKSLSNWWKKLRCTKEITNAIFHHKLYSFSIDFAACHKDKDKDYILSSNNLRFVPSYYLICLSKSIKARLIVTGLSSITF